jgi:hypothetical protein
MSSNKSIIVILLIFCFQKNIYAQYDLKGLTLGAIEKMRLEEQSKILTLNDLKFTFWLPVNSREDSEGIIFFDTDLVLFVNITNNCDGESSYFFMYPRYLIKYKKDDKKIIITDKQICYLENTYLFVGHESYGFAKYALHSSFIFLDDS